MTTLPLAGSLLTRFNNLPSIPPDDPLGDIINQLYAMATGASGVFWALREVLAAYVIDPATDCTISCTANSFAVTLPSAVGRTGQLFNIHNAGAGVISIATVLGQTVSGQASGTLTLAQWDNAQLQSNGANWIIL